MSPLKNTLILAQEYGPKLLTGKLSDTELTTLLGSFKGSGDERHLKHKFNNENYSSVEAVQNFVQYIGPYMSKEELHKLNLRLIPIEGAHTRTRPTLLKYLMAYEANRYGLAKKLLEPFNDLLNTIFADRSKTPDMQDFKKVAEKWDKNKAGAFIETMKIPGAIKEIYKKYFIAIVAKQMQINANQDPFNNPAFSKSLGDSLFFNIVTPALMLKQTNDTERTYADLILGQLKINPDASKCCADQVKDYDAGLELDFSSKKYDLDEKLTRLETRTKEKLESLYPPVTFDSEVAFTSYATLCKDIIDIINATEKQLPKKQGIYVTPLPDELTQLRTELKKLKFNLGPKSDNVDKLSSPIVIQFIEELQSKVPHNRKSTDGAINQGIKNILMKIENTLTVIKGAQQPGPEKSSGR